MVTLSEGLSDWGQVDKELKHHSVTGRKCPVSSAWTWALRSFLLMNLGKGDVPSLETKASPASGGRLGQSESASYEARCAGDDHRDHHLTESVLDSHCRAGREVGRIPGMLVLSTQRDAQDLEVMHRKVTIFTGKKNQS